MYFLKALILIMFMTFLTLNTFGCDYIRDSISDLKQQKLDELKVDSLADVEVFEIDLNQLEEELGECLIERNGFNFIQDRFTDE